MQKATNSNTKITWAFFGTSLFSTIVLDRMKEHGYIPALIVTTEDKPQGRKLLLTPPPVKLWAEREMVSYLQLKTLRTADVVDTIRSYSPNPEGFDVFVVASYGKIIPQAVLDIPIHKTLNVHPSLLPKLRGASPIQSSILSENESGVTIIRLDAEMDHGPILAQEKVDISVWLPYAEDMERTFANTGADMLATLLPDWIKGNVIEREQDHRLATFCKKIEKADAELDLNADPMLNLRKIRAYHTWPGAFFFFEQGEKKTRIIVKTAHVENNELILDKVVPEGKREMSFADFLKGRKNTN